MALISGTQERNAPSKSRGFTAHDAPDEPVAIFVLVSKPIEAIQSLIVPTLSLFK
jgi:hypothetical protein